MPAASTGHLKKEISLFSAFALGTAISSGFFLLPGMAFNLAGPAVIMAYLIAGLVIIPPLLCKSELATAMPRAGGVYFYLDRSLGPMAGTITGIATWISLTLKSSFALVGSGYYIGLFFEDPPVMTIAVGLAVVFTVLNVLGTAKATIVQNVLVVGVLAILTLFACVGLPEIHLDHFKDFAPHGTGSIVSIIGVVMISYMGVSKLASVAEEFRNPERDIPMGIFLSLGVAMVTYIVGLVIMIGVMPADELANTYTPAADAAAIIMGPTGRVVLSVAAVAAFISVANAGILSASRYPLAMARDLLIPVVFRRLGRFNTPLMAILLTGGMVVLQVVLMDPLVIAKYAGTTKMVLFGLLCVAVIVMRESGIHSYDPGFRTPLYPWIPLLGFFLSIAVIGFLKWEATVFAIGMVALGIIWFFWYARARVRRYGAIHHVFARLGKNRFDPLDIELREIIKEKGLRKADPFDRILASAPVIDATHDATFESITRQAAEQLSRSTGLDADMIAREFMQGTRIGATPVSAELALPHLRHRDIEEPCMVLARIRNGLVIEFDQDATSRSSETVEAVFYLVSPDDDPALHLRLLAKLAGSVEEEGFMQQWMEADTPAEIRDILLRTDRSMSLELHHDSPGREFITRAVHELDLPSGCLVAVIHRGPQTIIPSGDTVLDHGDAVTIIGEPDGIHALRQRLESESRDEILDDD
ncbi:MAG: amino acid permease [Phycisphaerae bacterium]|nr:amino acid permease [Phycisphaerae bacterium]